MLPASDDVHRSRALYLPQVSRHDAHAYDAHGSLRQFSPSTPAGDRRRNWRIYRPSSWRTKAAAQLPCKWLQFGHSICLANTPKPAPEHNACSLRCPSCRIAPSVNRHILQHKRYREDEEEDLFPRISVHIRHQEDEEEGEPPRSTKHVFLVLGRGLSLRYSQSTQKTKPADQAEERIRRNQQRQPEPVGV
jgi:hypothetical protein